MELLLDMVKCSNKIDCEYIQRAGWSRLFLLIIFTVLFLSSLYSQAIPWSLENDFICYFNAPLDWNKGFSNMEDIQEYIVNNQLNKRNQEFILELSVIHNCDVEIIQKLFRSRIVVIGNEKDKDFFYNIEAYLFDIEVLYSIMYKGLNEGILVVERYDGLEELLEIISDFDVEIIQQGNYLLTSKNNDNLVEYQNNIMNRNEFSEDILIYAETQEKNLTLTNAFSFINIETKTLNPIQEIPQFPIQILEIPIESTNLESLFVFSNQKTKDYFYNYFEVISSPDEWKIIYDLLNTICVYGFFYQFDNQWLLGFQSQNPFYENVSFNNQIKKWGITKTDTVKPYANEYYLTVVDDYFMISNFKPDIALESIKKNEMQEMMLEIQDKIGKRVVYEVGFEFNEVFDVTVYFFSTFDDRINRQVIRIF